MTPGARPSGLNLRVLALAILLMIGVGAVLSISAVKMLRALGFFPPEREPVEVFYEPYRDGKRLEDLLGPDERPSELQIWEVAPASGSELLRPEPAFETPQDIPQPPHSPPQPSPS